MPIKADAAETLSLQALAWLAGNEDLLPVFINTSGVDLSDIRHRASDPQFLAAVLDFLLMDDAWVLAFCESYGLAPTAPAAARAALPGGQLDSWT